MAIIDLIKGIVSDFVYRNHETGYAVLSCNTETGRITMIGDLAGAVKGCVLEARGDWKEHHKYGQQFAVSSWIESAPRGLESIRLYISDYTSGIGPKYAARIVAHFGADSIEVMDKTPERLIEVRGIGKKTLSKIKTSWAQQNEVRDLSLFLMPYGISGSLARRIYRKYKEASIAVIKENPYRLADEVSGIGFPTADKLAIGMGIDENSYVRLRSGALYVMHEITNSGHVYATREQIVDRAMELLNVDEVRLQATLDDMVATEEIVKEGKGALYLRPLYYAEKGIAGNLKRLLDAGGSLPVDIESIQTETGVVYDDAQADAIRLAMNSKVMVLTGGPGTGKTTVTKGIIAALEENGLDIQLAAPTGRAAKRMEEATGMESRTIHRLLESSKDGGFARNAENPIDGDVLIVDESSMIDTVLMNALLRAIPTSMRLILAGDVDQLPSVGPGTVLRDIIDSGAVPVIRLTKIFRQAQGSNIITNCHRVNNGECPEFKYGKDSDFFFVRDDNAEHIAQQVVELVKKRLPAAYSVSSMDIQVLAPQKTSVIGTRALNAALQAALNPVGPSIVCGDYTFRDGDKVIQMANNYDKEVFNGDVGFVKSVNVSDREITVDFEGREVEYSDTDLNELALAYAVTIHKSQGSEYPIVIIPLHTTNYGMLERHLVYTGFSRAKRLLVVVGSKRAMYRAVEHEAATKRQTMLKEWLIEERKEKTND